MCSNCIRKTLEEWLDETDVRIRRTPFGWGRVDAIRGCMGWGNSEAYYLKFPHKFAAHELRCRHICPIEVPHAIADICASSYYYGSYEMQILSHPLKEMILKHGADLDAFALLLLEIIEDTLLRKTDCRLTEVPPSMHAMLATLLYCDLKFLVTTEEGHLKLASDTMKHRSDFADVIAENMPGSVTSSYTSFIKEAEKALDRLIVPLNRYILERSQSGGDKRFESKLGKIQVKLVYAFDYS